MALSYKEALLVKGTLPALREHGETITSLFYENMLREHPELHNIFNRVNLVNGSQPRALCRVILTFASNINNITELIPQLERTCNKHCSLGILPEHYELISPYLLDAFGQVLGGGMTPAVRDAWAKAYRLLSRMLSARESQIYGSFRWSGWRRFRIDRKVAEADDVCSLYLVPSDGKPVPSFMPGQYVSAQVHMADLGHNQARQYSLSNAPSDGPGGSYRITVQRDLGARHANAVSACHFNSGIVSNQLVDLSVGDVLNLSNPSGDFYLDPTASSVPLVFMSAGIGIAPMVAMADAALQTQPNRFISWSYVSDSRFPPFRNHIAQLAQKYPNLETCSSFEEQDLFLDKGGTEYFICGSEDAMPLMLKRLADAGVQQSRVKVEEFRTGERAKPAEQTASVCGYSAGYSRAEDSRCNEILGK